MFIHTERTPNPKTVKFLPGLPVTERPDEYAAANRGLHPFLEWAFSLGAESVYLGSDFVSVNLGDGIEWTADKRDAMAGIIAGHLQSLGDISKDKTGTIVLGGDDAAVVEKILQLLDTHIRPAVAMDGGDITFASYCDGVLTLNMKGACSGCPSSAATLQHGIQNLMRHFIPEVREIRQAA